MAEFIIEEQMISNLLDNINTSYDEFMVNYIREYGNLVVVSFVAMHNKHRIEGYKCFNKFNGAEKLINNTGIANLEIYDREYRIPKRYVSNIRLLSEVLSNGNKDIYKFVELMINKVYSKLGIDTLDNKVNLPIMYAICNKVMQYIVHNYGFNISLKVFDTDDYLIKVLSKEYFKTSKKVKIEPYFYYKPKCIEELYNNSMVLLDMAVKYHMTKGDIDIIKYEELRDLLYSEIDYCRNSLKECRYNGQYTGYEIEFYDMEVIKKYLEEIINNINIEMQYCENKSTVLSDRMLEKIQG